MTDISQQKQRLFQASEKASFSSGSNEDFPESG